MSTAQVYYPSAALGGRALIDLLHLRTTRRREPPDFGELVQRWERCHGVALSEEFASTKWAEYNEENDSGSRRGRIWMENKVIMTVLWNEGIQEMKRL